MQADAISSRPAASDRGPLANPFFRAIWIASVVSNVGSTMHDTAAVWTMTTLTPSPTLVTLMQTMSSLPLFLFALPAGALADLIDRRKLILSAQWFALIVAGILTALAASHKLTESVLLVMTFLLGLGAAFTMPAWQALIPEVVERHQMARAITLGSIGINIARGLGPVFGGLLVSAAGPGTVFALNAASFIGFIIVMARGKCQSCARHPQTEQMIGAIIAALRFTRHSPNLHAVLVRNFTYAFCGVAPVALLPLMVRARHFNATDFGVFMGCYGLGGILTAVFVLPRLQARWPIDRLLLAAGVISTTSIFLLSLTHERVAMGIVLFMAGCAWLSSMSTLTFVAQNSFPNWVRARSSAIYLICSQGALAFGAVTWGGFTARTSPELALQMAGGGMLVSLLLIKYFPLNRAATLDLSPSHHWPGHNLALEPAPDDGPVLITIDYLVSLEQADAFRAAMNGLRRVRLRDGAFRWSLWQDLNEPGRFREVFLVGSWGEHLRQHDRATNEDRRIEDAVMRFHTGTEPPKVGHLLMRDVNIDAQT